MRFYVAFFFLFLGCGRPPTSASEADATATKATTPPCPPDPGGALGAACANEGQTCGRENPKGFSNLTVCSGGKWIRVEVPPPPPP